MPLPLSNAKYSLHPKAPSPTVLLVSLFKECDGNHNTWRRYWNFCSKNLSRAHGCQDCHSWISQVCESCWLHRFFNMIFVTPYEGSMRGRREKKERKCSGVVVMALYPISGQALSCWRILMDVLSQSLYDPLYFSSRDISFIPYPHTHIYTSFFSPRQIYIRNATPYTRNVRRVTQFPTEFRLPFYLPMRYNRGFVWQVFAASLRRHLPEEGEAHIIAWVG